MSESEKIIRFPQAAKESKGENVDTFANFNREIDEIELQLQNLAHKQNAVAALSNLDAMVQRSQDSAMSDDEKATIARFIEETKARIEAKMSVYEANTREAASAVERPLIMHFEIDALHEFGTAYAMPNTQFPDEFVQDHVNRVKALRGKVDTAMLRLEEFDDQKQAEYRGVKQSFDELEQQFKEIGLLGSQE